MCSFRQSQRCAKRLKNTSEILRFVTRVVYLAGRCLPPASQHDATGSCLNTWLPVDTPACFKSTVLSYVLTHFSSLENCIK